MESFIERGKNLSPPRRRKRGGGRLLVQAGIAFFAFTARYPNAKLVIIGGSSSVFELSAIMPYVARRPDGSASCVCVAIRNLFRSDDELFVPLVGHREEGVDGISEPLPAQ